MAADKEVRVNLQFSASGNAEEGLRRIGAAAEAAAASEKRLNSSMDETVAAGGRMPRRLASAESFYRTASGDAADTATAARSPAAYPWPFRYGAPVQPAASSYPAGVPGYAAPGGSRATGYSSAQAVAVGGSSEPRAASLRDAAYALRVVSLEAEAATARLAGTVSTLRGVGVGRQAQSNPAAVPLTRAAENRHDHSRGADRRTVSVLWRSEGGPVGPGGEHAELPAPRGRDRRLVYAEDDEHVVNAPAARANRPLLNLMNKVRGPVSWAAAKGRQLNEFITDRYGPRWGAAAKYGGPALSWAAFGAGAAMGQFVYVPIPVATGAIAGAAELYYQRHKIAAGAGKLAGTWRDVLFGNEQRRGLVDVYTKHAAEGGVLDAKMLRQIGLVQQTKDFRNVVRSVFGRDAQFSGGQRSAWVEEAGRKFAFNLLRDGRVELSFSQGQLDPAKRSSKQYGHGMYDVTAASLQGGTLAALDSLRKFVGALSQSGFGIQYEVTDKRRQRLYEKVMRSAGLTLDKSSETETEPIPGVAAHPDYIYAEHKWSAPKRYFAKGGIFDHYEALRKSIADKFKKGRTGHGLHHTLNLFEHAVGGSDLEALGQIPVGSKLLGAGVSALAFRAGRGDVHRVQPLNAMALANELYSDRTFAAHLFGTERPKSKYVLQAKSAGVFGNAFIERLPFAKPMVGGAGEIESRIYALYQKLHGEGYDWSDYHQGNVGVVGGRDLVLDPGGVTPREKRRKSLFERKPAVQRHRDALRTSSPLFSSGNMGFGEEEMAAVLGGVSGFADVLGSAGSEMKPGDLSSLLRQYAGGGTTYGGPRPESLAKIGDVSRVRRLRDDARARVYGQYRNLRFSKRFAGLDIDPSDKLSELLRAEHQKRMGSYADGGVVPGHHGPLPPGYTKRGTDGTPGSLPDGTVIVNAAQSRANARLLDALTSGGAGVFQPGGRPVMLTEGERFFLPHSRAVREHGAELLAINAARGPVGYHAIGDVVGGELPGRALAGVGRGAAAVWRSDDSVERSLSRLKDDLREAFSIGAAKFRDAFVGGRRAAPAPVRGTYDALHDALQGVPHPGPFGSDGAFLSQPGGPAAARGEQEQRGLVAGIGRFLTSEVRGPVRRLSEATGVSTTGLVAIAGFKALETAAYKAAQSLEILNDPLKTAAQKSRELAEAFVPGASALNALVDAIRGVSARVQLAQFNTNLQLTRQAGMQELQQRVRAQEHEAEPHRQLAAAHATMPTPAARFFNLDTVEGQMQSEDYNRTRGAELEVARARRRSAAAQGALGAQQSRTNTANAEMDRTRDVAAGDLGMVEILRERENGGPPGVARAGGDGAALGGAHAALSLIGATGIPGASAAVRLLRGNAGEGTTPMGGPGAAIAGGARAGSGVFGGIGSWLSNTAGALGGDAIGLGYANLFGYGEGARDINRGMSNPNRMAEVGERNQAGIAEAGGRATVSNQAARDAAQRAEEETLRLRERGLDAERAASELRKAEVRMQQAMLENIQARIGRMTGTQRSLGMMSEGDFQQGRQVAQFIRRNGMASATPEMLQMAQPFMGRELQMMAERRGEGRARALAGDAQRVGVQNEFTHDFGAGAPTLSQLRQEGQRLQANIEMKVDVDEEKLAEGIAKRVETAIDGVIRALTTKLVSEINKVKLGQYVQSNQSNTGTR